MEAKYLIQVKPPAAYTKFVTDFIAQYSNNFLKINDNHTHLTLFAMYSDDAYQKSIVESINTTMNEPFYTSIEGLFLGTTDNFGEKMQENHLVVNFKKNGPLKLLHFELAHRLQPYITKQLGNLSHEFKENILRTRAHDTFGSPYFGLFYSPHTTIGVLQPEHSISLDVNIFNGLGWSIDKLLLAKKIPGKQWNTIEQFDI